jgi:proteasome lid subunit RPN8/RPN11
MLQLPQSVYDRLREHGESAYPDECCGILLGRVDGSARVVARSIPVANGSVTPRNHYRIDPLSLIQADREARAAGHEVLGFYHSHPDHPAEPSATDLAEAHWLGCSYVIVSVIQGQVDATHSFRLDGVCEEDKHFKAEEIGMRRGGVPI